MSGPTPGPWNFRHLFGRDEFGIFWTDKSIAGTLQTRVDNKCGEFKEPDARLIAAAPELLVALIEMRDLFDLMCGLGFNPAEGQPNSPKAKADAAIAKATT